MGCLLDELRQHKTQIQKITSYKQRSPIIALRLITRIAAAARHKIINIRADKTLPKAEK